MKVLQWVNRLTNEGREVPYGEELGSPWVKLGGNPTERVEAKEVVEVEESPEDDLNGPMATYYKAINRFNTQV